MKKLLSLFTLLLVLISGSFSLQGQRRCGSMEELQRQLLADPSLKQRMEAIERHTEAFIKKGGAKDRTVITIPVVVHVVYKTAAQNVSLAQVQSQIDEMNLCFRLLNADQTNIPSVFQSLAADTEINFCLAQQDPSGNITTGIERRKTTVSQFTNENDAKHYATGGLNGWDRDRYCNIWCAPLVPSLLGVGSFPGGPADLDGIVLNYTNFGQGGTATAPFDLGRVALHEGGHWLNLRHIWGDDGGACDGTDFVDDTPNAANNNDGCVTFPHVTCNNGPNGDLFMDYMDYSDDACILMFTHGQKDRMHATFAPGGGREGLVTSLGCTPGANNGACGIPAGLNATNITLSSATLNWQAVGGATKYTLQRKLSSSSTWTTVNGILGTSYNVSGLAVGTTYDYRVQAFCGTVAGTFSAVAQFTTTAASCPDQFEPNNTRATATTGTVVLGPAFPAQIASATDQDWYKFANTAAKPNIQVHLSNLPADYDLRLYRGTTLVASSLQTGLVNEDIVFNTSTVSANYYVQVIGYSGAFDNNLCYTLNVNLTTDPAHSNGQTETPIEKINQSVVFENAGFGIFPNPASDAVTLEIPMTADADVQISLLDPAGKTITQTSQILGKTNNRVQINLNDLPTGMYFVQVRNGDAVKTRKLVVNK